MNGTNPKNSKKEEKLSKTEHYSTNAYSMLAAVEISSSSLALSPVDTYSILANLLFLKRNLNGKLPAMNWKVQLSAQMAFDNVEQLDGKGDNEVTDSANQMDQLLSVHNPALTLLPKSQGQGGKWLRNCCNW